MKRKAAIPVLIVLLAIMSLSVTAVPHASGVIDKVRLSGTDIPQGYVLGKIPNFARTTFKDNPWLMDNASVKKLAGEIYPGGNGEGIATIHMTIIAREQRPFGDDIVCYIILFRDMSAAKDELKKINDYVGYNSDRAMVLSRDNIAVFLHVDNVDDFHYIRDLAGVLEKRLQEL